MTEGILKFNLPEDQDDFIMACKGHIYYSALWDIGQHIRVMQKYRNFSEEQEKVIEELQDFFYSTVGDLLEEVM